jgi:hypothetical protein
MNFKLHTALQADTFYFRFPVVVFFAKTGLHQTFFGTIFTPLPLYLGLKDSECFTTFLTGYRDFWHISNTAICLIDDNTIWKNISNKNRN